MQKTLPPTIGLAVALLFAFPASACEDPHGSLHLCVTTHEPAGQDVVVRVQPQDSEPWELRFTKAEWQKPIVVAMERGSYEVSVESPHFVPHRTELNVSDQPVDVIAALQPLRTIGGVVVERASRAAVANAKVSTQHGISAISDRHGRFAIELDPRQWPADLMVSADGFGSRTVPVPPVRANATLPPIELGRGATLSASIQQTVPGQVTAVELVRLQNGGRRPGRVVQAQMLAKSTSRNREVRFEDVEPGQYVVVARGGNPAECAGERTDVRTADTPPVQVQITPYRLRLRTLRDGTPFDARVILRHHDALWEAPVAVPSTGDAHVTLWQTGRLSATVESRESVPYRLRRTIVDPVDADWLLEMPDLEVAGEVIDAETRTPVAHAAVALEMTSPEHRHLSVSTRADADGRFRFAPVFPGGHTVRAAAADYPPAELTYSFAEDDDRRTLTVALQRMPATNLSLIDPRGRPLAGVDVFVFRGNTQVMRNRTGTTGHVPVFVPKGETRDVFAVPRDGSLAVMRIEHGRTEATMIVREAVSSIVVRAETARREPIANAGIDVRFDGFLLPFEVMEAVTGRGSRTTSDANGRVVLDHMPAGAYELRAASGESAGDWATLVATPGENTVVLTLAPRPSL